MKKKIVTLGLAVSLVASPYALANEELEVEEIGAITEELELEEVHNIAEDVKEEEAIAVEVTEIVAEDVQAGSVEVTEELADLEEVNLAEDVTVVETAPVERTTIELVDIEQSWAKEEIETLVNAGILTASPDGTFNPTANMTVTEFVYSLGVALGLEGDSSLVSSEDVTREQLAVSFVLALGFEEDVVNLDLELPFADNNEISENAQAHVAFLTAIDFIKGIDREGTLYFDPQGNAERQAVARLLYELYVNGDEYKAKGIALVGSPVEEDSAPAEEATEEEITEEEVNEENVTEEAAEEESVSAPSEEEADVEEDSTEETEEDAVEEDTTDEETDEETVDEEEETTQE